METVQQTLSKDKLMGFTTPHKLPYLLTDNERLLAKLKFVQGKIDAIKWRRGYVPTKMANGRPYKPKVSLNELLGAVMQLNTLKYYNEQEKIWKEEDRQKKLENQKWVMENYDSKYMFRLIRSVTEKMGKEFILGENGSQHFNYIKALCFFMGEDMRFETEMGYSFKKGLWVRGDFGTGKTHAIKCLAENKRNPIDIHSMLYISKSVKSSGEYKISVPPGRTAYIDDVGTEEATINHFGTHINWFKDFIERTDFTPKLYNRIIVTTNISDFNEIEKLYGGRVRDRVKHMFNIIDVTGASLRK